MKTGLRVAAAVLLAAAAFLGGARWARRAEAPAQQAVVYACPMHPQYRSDHPGDCPSCGMRLEPSRDGGAADTRGGDEARPLPPGAVQVSFERQQAVGVRLGVAEQVSGTRLLRTSGRVAPNENATYPIVAGVSGWIRSLGAATTGTRVRRNEVLASFYAPEFINTLQSYYAGLETVGRVSTEQLQVANRNRFTEGVQRYADTLRNMGVSEQQLEEMSRKRTLVQDIHLTSPVDGFVLQRNVSMGLRFDRGFEFYRIADLSTVWILADVYQHQLRFIKPGAKAQLTSAQVSRPFSAIVSRAEPIFDEATLTLKVRLEADNPGFVLKPGMFVDVELPVQLPPTLAVPADAIVDSGTRKTVYVDRGDGYFEPRQVETGWRVADQVEVLRGLMVGERIVISGTFLIDSESRMKAAAHGIFGESVEDPVCGMHVDEKRAAAAGKTLEHDGKTYAFCSDECKRAFATDPGRYLELMKPLRGARPATAARRTTAQQAPTARTKQPEPTATAKDPICGMDVVVEEAVAAGRVSEHAGRRYYFCADSCKKSFDADPARYVAGDAAAHP